MWRVAYGIEDRCIASHHGISLTIALVFGFLFAAVPTSAADGDFFIPVPGRRTAAFITTDSNTALGEDAPNTTDDGAYSTAVGITALHNNTAGGQKAVGAAAATTLL